MTVDDVCEEAGLSKGAFYSPFASKQELLDALIDDDARAVTTILDDLEAQSLDGHERLRRLTRMMLDRVEDGSRIQVRANLWAAALTEPAIRELPNTEVDAHNAASSDAGARRRITGGEIVDLPANALASTLLALNDGPMLHRTLDDSGFRRVNVSGGLDALLAGITTA